MPSGGAVFLLLAELLLVELLIAELLINLFLFSYHTYLTAKPERGLLISVDIYWQKLCHLVWLIRESPQKVGIELTLRELFLRILIRF